MNQYLVRLARCLLAMRQGRSIVSHDQRISQRMHGRVRHWVRSVASKTARRFVAGQSSWRGIVTRRCWGVAISLIFAI